MAESIYTRKTNEVTAPVAGQMTVIAGSTTASSLDLTTTGPQTQNMSDSGKDAVPSGSGTTVMGGMDRYVEFQADGVDVGLNFGSTSAAVTGANAPSLTATGTNATQGCTRLFNGTTRSYYIHPATKFVGYVASANAGFLRITISSR